MAYMTERDGGDDVELTEAQAKALTILADESDAGRPGLTPGEFAQKMWPDSPAWRNVSNVGGYGAARGVGITRAGGGFLGKLRRAGLTGEIDAPGSDGKYQYHFITVAGLSALGREAPPSRRRGMLTTEKCGCFYYEPDPGGDGDECNCSHAADEHDDEGECQAMVEA